MFKSDIQVLVARTLMTIIYIYISLFFVIIASDYLLSYGNKIILGKEKSVAFSLSLVSLLIQTSQFLFYSPECG